MRPPRRLATTVALVAVLVLAGCFGGFGGSGYTLTATDVTESFPSHATEELSDDEWRVLRTATDATNATARTVGRPAVANRSYVAIDGAFYRTRVRQVDERTVTVPAVTVVHTNASATMQRSELPELDQRRLAHAYKYSQARDERNASVRDPEFAALYFHGANDSRLLDANGTVVEAYNESLRVVVFEATVEAPVYRHRLVHVADSAAGFRAAVAHDLTGLSDRQTEIFEQAVEDGYTADTEAVESGNATAFTGLVRKAGIDLDDRHGRWTAYALRDGRVYYVEVHHYEV